MKVEKKNTREISDFTFRQRIEMNFFYIYVYISPKKVMEWELKNLI